MNIKFLNLKNNNSFRMYFNNSLWMLLEQFLRIVSGLFVGIYVARYLGPEKFGLLSYVLAVVSLFSVFSRLGMESILIREIVNNPEEKNKFIGTAFVLMMFGSIVSMVVISVLISLVEDDVTTIFYIGIISTGLIFQSFLVFDYAFQAETKARLSSIGKSVALLSGSLFKVYLVLVEADLEWIVLSFIIEQILTAVFLFLIYFKVHRTELIMKFSLEMVRPLVKSSWPMIMSGVAGMILIRVDQIMIKIFMDENSLGLYAAAAKIYQGWITFPFVLSLSVLPLLVKLKEKSQEKYEENLTILLGLVFWLCFVFAIIITFFNKIVIELSFGVDFSGAAHVLVIMSWTSSLAAFGFMSARFLIVEGMEKKIAMRNWIAIAINIPLNYLLIPKMGIDGAAYASLLSLFAVHYMMDFMDSDLKILLKLKNNAILFKFKGASR